MDRREFIKHIGSAAVATSVVLSACKNNDNEAPVIAKNVIDGQGEMTYRTNPNSGDKVSLLGYGMMRLPIENGADMRKDPNARVDQEMVNEEVDYALAHGVNYFDTAPVYTRGYSETSTGIALSRHPRNSYYIATKLSNFSPSTWSLEASQAMFENSLKQLQTDYVDYLLLHSIGGSSKELGSHEMLNARFIENGLLDWLVEQKKAGRIRNLGFSFHGDPKLFDTVMQWHDEGRYHWDFVQIQMNYVDWSFAEIDGEGVNSSYLYEELHRRGIPVVIMEPLLGGRLAKQPDHIVKQMKEREPESPVARWAFRYAGTPEGILTVLSGMTYMEHLKDNLLSYCPLEPLSEKEMRYLDYEIAQKIVSLENIPCNDCKYCMPCPYGIDIPAIFVHYNKCKNEGSLPMGVGDQEYRKHRRQYLISLDRVVPRDRQPDHCIQCGQCEPHCPQNIRIPRELRKIDEMIERLKRDPEGVGEEIG